MSNDDNLYTQLKNKFLNNKIIAYAGIIMVGVLFLINFWEKVSSIFEKEDVYIEAPVSHQDKDSSSIQIEQTFNHQESNSNYNTTIEDTPANNSSNQQLSRIVSTRQKRKLCFSTPLLETISVSDFEPDILNGLGSVSLSESSCINVSLGYTGEIVKVAETHLYQYLGGEASITIDDKQCQILSGITLPSSLPEGNTKNFLEKRILAQLKSIADDNKEEVILAIKSCLLKSY